MTRLLILTLLLCSCEKLYPTIECKEGSEVVDNICILPTRSYMKIEEEHVEICVNALQEMLNERYPEMCDITDLFNEVNLVVKFTHKKLYYDCKKIFNHFECQGSLGGIAYEPGRAVYVKYDQCLPRSAFIHELLHVIEWQWFGETEEHLRKFFFAENFGKDSIEYKAVLKALEDINCYGSS